MFNSSLIQGYVPGWIRFVRQDLVSVHSDGNVPCLLIWMYFYSGSRSDTVQTVTLYIPSCMDHLPKRHMMSEHDWALTAFVFIIVLAWHILPSAFAFFYSNKHNPLDPSSGRIRRTLRTGFVPAGRLSLFLRYRRLYSNYTTTIEVRCIEMQAIALALSQFCFSGYSLYQTPVGVSHGCCRTGSSAECCCRGTGQGFCRTGWCRTGIYVYVSIYVCISL